eukprot:TRINITY_DN11437_c0_g1_i18.p1 TRINITY_DN11437_c0_g1~~TRINITY_DN11437_c0_g1_i18.p1  ORF type:complete len:220 (+),score=67.01 TRINITY_DN11437_c0_g1_i18:304-963(+)
MKVKESVEEYLGSVDIGLLETPGVGAKSAEEVLTLIGAKNEKEAIGVMYQTLSLVEVYVNRVIQHGLITFYNASKFNADKPVNHYFESDLNVITEMAEQYLHLASAKKRGKNAVLEDAKSDLEQNSKVIKQHEELKKKYEDLVKRFNNLSSTHSINAAKMEISDVGITKLKEEMERLKTQLDKEKELRAESLRAIKEKEIEISSFVDEINAIKASREAY